MTVAQLIEELGHLPPHLEVLMPSEGLEENTMDGMLSPCGGYDAPKWYCAQTPYFGQAVDSDGVKNFNVPAVVLWPSNRFVPGEFDDD